MTLSIKEKLKEWKLLKTKEDYEFFYRITKMLGHQKIEEFGEQFIKNLEILTDIVRNGREQDAKIYIDSLEDKSRKIVATETYFSMRIAWDF